MSEQALRNRWLKSLVFGAAIVVATAAAVSSAPDDEHTSDWWAYQPLERPALPEVNDESWPTSDIDRFILAKLEQNELRPSPRASKRALVRRAFYDLTGLPPTPDEVDAFVNDDAPDALARLIDRLLESPQYGEKWGRHWLDLVRFAETDSYERDRLKPNAWKYRDYVINSFNNDKPYDQFILEQLAGDELDEPTLESMIATGYYRLGIWDDEPTDVLQAQYDDLDSVLATTGQVFLGMTLNCARCHDHKGDPIPQRDYYRMLAFFENIKPYKAGGGNAPTPANYLKMVPVDLGRSDFDQETEGYLQQRTRLLDRIADTRTRLIAAGEANGVATTAAHEDEHLLSHVTFDEAAGEIGSELEGRFGAAGQFDGVDDFLRIARPVQNDFTISLWLRTRSTGPGGSDYRWFLGAGLVDGEIRGIVGDFGLSYHSDGRLTAGVGKPETFIHSPAGFNDGEWHHVAFTRQQDSGTIALYVDGEHAASATGSTEPLDASEFVDIGRMQPGYGYFAGSLDDVRIYDRVLDHREILDIAHGPGFDDAFAEQVRAVLGAEEHRRHDEHIRRLVALERPTRAETQILCVQERGSVPPESFVQVRGNAHVRDERVYPGFPSVLQAGDAQLPNMADDAPTTGRRRVLAEWLAGRDNILSARVMANRLWQYHFGRGIVPTPNDFGRFGELPTHPELLDWLAVEFMDRDWSIKSMHRLIMLSSVYQMTSKGHPSGLAADPENRLMWRFNMRRLGAEELRDSMLAVNGALNLEMGGPGVYPPMPEEVLATSSRPNQAWGQSPADQAARRSIYIHVKRSLLSPLLVAFDLADTDQSCPVRFATTQPTQALTMLNSDDLQVQSELLAQRLAREAGPDITNRVDLAFRLTTSRHATAQEAREGAALIRSLQVDDGMSPDEAMKYFCLVMLNLNEFIYLD